MSKELVLDFLEKHLDQLYKVFYKWGLFVVLLMFSVTARVLFEIINTGKFKFVLLFCISLLGFCIGCSAIIICVMMGWYDWRAGVFVFVAAISGFKIVEMLVKMDMSFYLNALKDAFFSFVDTIRSKKM